MRIASPIITLTTDFGLKDWFVGAMKGVIWSICPRVQIADISHDVPPGQIAAGAFVLASACQYFPRGTIHVAVIDPGVGSRRAALVAQTRAGFFIGPDNGVLSIALEREPPIQVRHLRNSKYFRHPLSATFHGRDIFAPVAAYLAGGASLRSFGPAVSEYHRIIRPEPKAGEAVIQGEICYLDQFGNAITNIPGSWLKLPIGKYRLQVKRRHLPMADHYQDVAAGRPVGLVGSHACIEIAVNGGSAAKLLGLRLGTRVKLAVIPAISEELLRTRNGAKTRIE